MLSGQGGGGGGGNCYSSKLTRYAAWWNRMEKLGTNFYSEVRKEENERLLRKKENGKKKKEIGEFIKKLFPSCKNSFEVYHGNKVL